MPNPTTVRQRIAHAWRWQRSGCVANIKIKIKTGLGSVYIYVCTYICWIFFAVAVSASVAASVAVAAYFSIQKSLKFERQAANELRTLPLRRRNARATHTLPRTHTHPRQTAQASRLAGIQIELATIFE